MFNDPSLQSGIYVLCVMVGMALKRYVIDIVYGWIVNKMKPGIIQEYLEDVLGVSQKKPLPPFMIVPIQPSVPPVPEVQPVPSEPVPQVDNNSPQA